MTTTELEGVLEKLDERLKCLQRAVNRIGSQIADLN
jgi:hypothetical protein